MHTFTRQQRQGGARYTPRCLIGNYYEDIELQGSVLKVFIQRKEAGDLHSTRYQQRMATALAPIEMTKIRDDPYVHFGDVLQLVHVNTGCVMAVDVEDKDPQPGEQSCTASGTSEPIEPIARNTVLITKYIPNRPSPLERQWDGDVLRYGQKIRILANPMAQGEPLNAVGGEQPLALYSRPYGINCTAKYSRHQLVGFTWKAENFDSVWQVQALNPADRLSCEGVEVVAGAPLLLVHCQTQVPLNLEEGVRRPSEFGNEFEVSAHAETTTGKQLGLEHMTRGDTSKTLPKPNLSSNYWTFVTGNSIRVLPDSIQAGLGSLERSLAGVQQQLQDKPGARQALEQKVVRLASSNGCMEAGELVLALRQVGVDISEDEGASMAAELAARQQAAVAEAGYKLPNGRVSMQCFFQALDAVPTGCGA